MSTNVKTKKYDMLEKQSGVALLIHDFSEVTTAASSDEDGSAPRLTGEYSITLNGTCSVVKDGKNNIIVIIIFVSCVDAWNDCQNYVILNYFSLLVNHCKIIQCSCPG